MISKSSFLVLYEIAKVDVNALTVNEKDIVKKNLPFLDNNYSSESCLNKIQLYLNKNCSSYLAKNFMSKVNYL